MSEKHYTTTLNNIQTMFCEFNFISDENGNKLIFDNKDNDFKQFDYVVNEDVLDCQREQKNSYNGNLNI